MEKDNTFLGTEPIGKLLFKLSLPAILAQLINMLYNLVDRIYIGHMPVDGALALTGLGVCMPLIMIISAFACLVSMGGAPRASIYMGRQDNETAEKIMGNSVVLLGVVSILLTIIISIWNKDILLLFGASENTIGYASSYMTIYAAGTVFVQFALGMNAFITAQGFAKTSMITILVGAISNIILDPIFIYGFNMGVQGAAIATIISQAISAIWVMSFLCGKKTILKVRAKYLRFNPKIILPCVALGLAPFIMQATESVIEVCYYSSLKKFGGDIAVGAMTILSSIMQFTMLPLQGLGQGAQPIASYNFGAGNADRLKETFKKLLLACVVYSGTVWLLVMCVPNVFATIFTLDVALINFADWALRIYMAMSILMGIQIACQMILIAVGNAKASVFVAVLRKIVILIPLIYILPLMFENKVMAVYMAEPIADFLAVTGTVIIFTIVFKKTLKMIKTDNISTIDIDTQQIEKPNGADL
ncbi:MAG: MATE family efflux transporter [Clostridia bacterium]